MNYYIKLFFIFYFFAQANFYTIANSNRIDSIDVLNDLSIKYRRENYTKSMEFALKASEQSEKLNYIYGKAKGFNNIAALLVDSNIYEALEYYQSSKILFNSIRQYKDYSYTLSNIGVCYEKLYDYDKASEYYIEALGFFDKMQDSIGLAACYNNLGVILQKQNNLSESLSYFKKSLEIKNLLNNTFSYKQTLSNIGNIYYLLDSLDNAMKIFNNCFLIEKDLNDSQSLIYTHLNIGNTYSKLNNEKNAILHYEKAIDIADSLNNIIAISTIYSKIGELNFELNNYDKAEEYFLKSIKILNKDYNNYDNLISYKYLSEIYELKGDLELALNYHQLYSQLLSIQLKNKVIPESVANYYYQKKDQTIDTLSAVTARQQRNIIILIALLVLTLVISYFIFLNKKLKHQIEIRKRISEEQQLRFMSVIEALEMERKRIAGDLHDSLGYMLSTVKLNLSGMEEGINNKDENHIRFYNNALELIDNACAEVRTLSHNLMPASLRRLGLIAGLKDMIRKINDSGKLIIQYDIVEIKQRIEEKKEIAIYRIIQELCNNIIKHANADKALINIKINNSIFIATIQDNGKGIMPENLEKETGIGWKNIYSRVEMLNGKVEIDFNYKNGTSIKLNIPIN